MSIGSISVDRRVGFAEADAQLAPGHFAHLPDGARAFRVPARGLPRLCHACAAVDAAVRRHFHGHLAQCLWPGGLKGTRQRHLYQRHRQRRREIETKVGPTFYF